MVDVANSIKRPQAHKSRAAPLDVWLRAVLLVLVFFGVVMSYFIFVQTPLESVSDESYYEDSVNQLLRRADKLEFAGEKPIKVMFVGTSRAKNVAIRTDLVTEAAKSAGIERPVVSSFIAINWGGFERLEPAVPLIANANPDYVIIMPELLYEDFDLLSRAKIGYRFLQQKLWGREFRLFPSEKEFEKPACSGFDDSVSERLRVGEAWISFNPKGRGPIAAASAIREFAQNGVNVIVAEIPVHSELSALKKTPENFRKAMETHDLYALQNVRYLRDQSALPDDVFCDYAHISPEKAQLWLRPLFEELGNKVE